MKAFAFVPSASEKLFDILQCRKLDVKYAQDKIHDFIQSISNKCDSEHYENMIQQTMTDMEISDESHAPPTKRTRGNRINYKSVYFEIIQNIISSLKERFANIGDFSYFELLDVQKFEVFSCTFPKQHIDALQKKYPGIFLPKSLAMSETTFPYHSRYFSFK